MNGEAIGGFIGGVVVGAILMMIFIGGSVLDTHESCCKSRGGRWLENRCFKSYEELKP